MGQSGAAVPHSVPSGATLGIVRARYNDKINDALALGCVQRLHALGATDKQIRSEVVAGAVELPLAAQWLVESGCAGVVVIGTVIRGETAHFDYVCDAVTRGTMDVSLKSNKPIVFCVLTVDTERQAWDRVGGSVGHKGIEAADTLVEMLALGAKLGRS